MRGTDVVKAMILGADAVGIGRMQCLGMAAGGDQNHRSLRGIIF